MKTKRTFKVEIRKTCKVCGEPITGERYRTYCSAVCRTKATNVKHYKSQIEWATKNRAKFGPGKIQCHICKGWFVQVCSHVTQKHKMTGRQYRQMLGKDVKKGLIPAWYREIKSEKNLATFDKIVANLKKGKRNWFKKGDLRAGRYVRSEETMERLHKGTKRLIK